MRKNLFLSMLLMLFCSMQLSAYTLYFHKNLWSEPYEKFAVQSWAVEESEAVWSDFMTPVAGHEGWVSATVPDGNSNIYVAAFDPESTDPQSGSVWSWSGPNVYDGKKAYWYDYIGMLESFEGGKLDDGSIFYDNILFNVDDENHTAEVAWQGDISHPNTTIPSSFTYNNISYAVTAIRYEAYQYNGITSISIPGSVKTISESAFYGCSNLASITISEGVETIGRYAFCQSPITSITIPSTVKYIDWDIFGSCNALTDVTLAEGLTVLGGAMFQDCNALEHITIPNSIKELPAVFLADCDNLNSVTLGTGVDTIGENAFSGSDKLARLTIYAPAPPAVNDYNNPDLVETCSLMVPSAVKAAYQAHPYWSQFDIKGIYIVTFKGIDGKTIKTEAVEEGKSATAPDAPEVGCYTFNRWDVDFSDVHSDLEVNALYTQNVYTVTFLNEGVQHNQQHVFCGEDATKPADPTKEGHHFTGWDAAFTNVQSDLTINAKFEINTYTVTFKDIDDQIIGEPQVVNWNTAAVAPKAPEVECNHFIGWDKAFEHVTENLVVTAQYAINQYTVTFLDWNDAELDVQIVDCGGDAAAPANPSREGYNFTGWDKAFKGITSNLTVHAVYAIKTFTVTFKDIDEQIIGEPQVVAWNTAAEAPEAPKVECYTFTGWDKAFTNVKEDLVVNALYSLNTYTVIFNDNDGSELSKQIVDCGDDAVAPAAPHHTGYTFIGWDKEFTNVHADLVVTATFERGEDAAITVEFYDNDKEKIASSNVVIRIPAADDIEGFYFVGWRPVAENILDNATIKIEAMYIPIEPTSAPDVYTNPANPAQKLVRDGNVYILKDGHEYTITGLKVK